MLPQSPLLEMYTTSLSADKAQSALPDAPVRPQVESRLRFFRRWRERSPALPSSVTHGQPRTVAPCRG
jgi:hypothetical protein